MEQVFNGLEISASGLTAQRKRMEVIAHNIANANTTRTPEGGPFQRKFLSLVASVDPETGEGNGVAIDQIKTDTSEGHQVYDPAHPDADEKGYVHYPNVSVVTEMVDLMQTSRIYEANISVLSAAKAMMNKALELSR